VRHRASALAVALGLAAGALYLANVYLGLDGAVATALIRLERSAPLPDHMLVSEALTKPPAEVAPSEAVVAAPSEKPTSATDIKAESHRASLSNDESGLSREAAMGAAEYSGQSPENNDPRNLAPPSSDLTESTGTDSDRASEPGSPVVNDTLDSGEAVNSEAQFGTGISVDEGPDGASTGGNLLPSAEESSPANLRDAEPPLAPQDDTVV
jgi:hypothetical protein